MPSMALKLLGSSRSYKRRIEKMKMMGKKVRFAVIGLGNIAQEAVLPGYKNAQNASVNALISGSQIKLQRLGKKYKVSNLFSYEEYEDCLSSGMIDAVYIALPNSLHKEYAVKAAEYGIHVLCEKPMAVKEEDCKEILQSCEINNVKLMIAYRLHFERANLKAIEIARSGKLGDLRIFNSTFTMQVRDEDNIRLRSAVGGGTLYDIGIYCINAARYLFRDEPEIVTAISANNGERRFKEVDEMTSAVLKFPQERLASFTCSFGSAESASYEIIGTHGSLRVGSAYEYAEKMEHTLTLRGKTTRQTFPKRDQFGAEIDYFSDCVLKGKDPEPSGIEGLADVRIIEALYESAQEGRSIPLAPVADHRRPSLAQEIRKPPIRKQETILTSSPHSDT